MFCEFCEKKRNASQGYNLFSAKNINLCEFCEKDVTFPKGRMCFQRNMLISVVKRKVIFFCVDFVGDVFKFDTTGVILLVDLTIT